MGMHRLNTRRRRRSSSHGGMALILVVFAISVAAVMGYALLASGSLQAQAGRNAVQSAQAESLAQSGIDLAMWHLQNSGGQWSGKSGITLGSTPGSVDVSCQDTGDFVYQITSTARSQGVTRTAVAQVQLMMPMAITSEQPGFLSSLLNTVLKLVGQVAGALLEGHSISLNAAQQLTQKPDEDGVRQIYSPLSGTYGLSSPGQVFWVNGDATLKSDLVIRGLLIVTGDLTIDGAGIRITRTSSMPVTGSWPAAVIVGGKLLPGQDSQATIDGGLWVGEQIGEDSQDGFGLPPVGQDSQLIVTGPVMIGDGGIKPTYQGVISVRPRIKVIFRSSAGQGH